MTSYLRDPAEIYRRSFAAIRAEADLAALPPGLQHVAVRMIHACGMTDIVADLRWSEDFAERARDALAQGAGVITDVRMVADGIISPELRGGRIACVLDDAPAMMERTTTRTAAALAARPDLSDNVVVIGNAPTALFRLLELIDEGAARPAAIIGLPVGFVGAAESKAELAAKPHGIPFLTLLGRRGGSAMAAAAVNALTLREPS
jgi:precorrin-8X/cobalt-precorrin-8 methylmutase